MTAAATGMYSRWAAWLGAFARGEDPLTDELEPLSIARLGSTGASRIADRCQDALNSRIRIWSDAFSRDVAGVGDPEHLRFVIVSSRRRLDTLRRFAASELLFDELRRSLTEGLERVAREAQETLEKEVTRNPQTRETLLRIVREQPLWKSLRLDLGSPGPAEPAGSTTSRRVILDA